MRWLHARLGLRRGGPRQGREIRRRGLRGWQSTWGGQGTFYRGALLPFLRWRWREKPSGVEESMWCVGCVVGTGFCMAAVATPGHRGQAAAVRRLLAGHARSEDLIRVGAYKAGTDEDLDRAIRAMPLLREFLEQRSDESVTMQESVARLNAMEL